MRRARRDYESLVGIATSLSASIDDVALLVTAQSDRLKDADNARKKMEKDLASYRVRERYDATSADASGVRTIVIRDAGSIDELRTIAQAAFALSKVVVVGALVNPPSVLFASSEDSGVDCGKFLKEKLVAAGGRGGGSPRIAQGSVPGPAAVESVVESLITRDG